MDLDHCHISALVIPSGSDDRVAITSSPTRGLMLDRATMPGSSTLVTVTVTFVGVHVGAVVGHHGDHVDVVHVGVRRAS